MEKYFLFVVEAPYPNGGSQDSKGIFDTIEEARTAGLNYDAGDDYLHITIEVIQDNQFVQIEQLYVEGWARWDEQRREWVLREG